MRWLSSRRHTKLFHLKLFSSLLCYSRAQFDECQAVFFSLRGFVWCSSPSERDIKVVRPLYSVEVTETETAKFETEISEGDVHGNWKLKGEAVHQSAVSLLETFVIFLDLI